MKNIMKIKRNVVVDLKRAFPSLGSDISESGLALIHEGRFANAAVLRYRDRNLDLTIKDFSGSPLLIKAVFGMLSTRTEYRAKKALAEALGENGNLCLLSPWSLAFDYVCGETLDVDGGCGGYNLQWACSSGRAAGEAIIKEQSAC